ncbi:hypothetical protein B296_00015075 [Ensete ventricosum]|uniref:Uncharacterized protein n=1 Tax=Ensete ventricosum TaxID=4639 RepID=A0A426Z3S5_ENSVE|nr:hypothetical protein B296_00015075 [Ensete ventricosum]
MLLPTSPRLIPSPAISTIACSSPPLQRSLPLVVTISSSTTTSTAIFFPYHRPPLFLPSSSSPLAIPASFHRCHLSLPTSPCLIPFLAISAAASSYALLFLSHRSPASRRHKPLLQPLSIAATHALYRSSIVATVVSSPTPFLPSRASFATKDPLARPSSSSSSLCLPPPQLQPQSHPPYHSSRPYLYYRCILCFPSSSSARPHYSHAAILLPLPHRTPLLAEPTATHHQSRCHPPLRPVASASTSSTFSPAPKTVATALASQLA